MDALVQHTRKGSRCDAGPKNTPTDNAAERILLDCCCDAWGHGMPLSSALSRGACVVIGADGSSAMLGGTQRRDSRNRVATRSAATCSTRFTSPNCVSGKLLKSMSRCSNWRPPVASSTANRTSCSATLR